MVLKDRKMWDLDAVWFFKIFGANIKVEKRFLKLQFSLYQNSRYYNSKKQIIYYLCQRWLLNEKNCEIYTKLSLLKFLKQFSYY